MRVDRDVLMQLVHELPAVLLAHDLQPARDRRDSRCPTRPGSASRSCPCIRAWQIGPRRRRRRRLALPPSTVLKQTTDEHRRPCRSRPSGSCCRGTTGFSASAPFGRVGLQHALLLEQHDAGGRQAPDHVGPRVVLLGEQARGDDAGRIAHPGDLDRSDCRPRRPACTARAARSRSRYRPSASSCACASASAAARAERKRAGAGQQPAGQPLLRNLGHEHSPSIVRRRAAGRKFCRRRASARGSEAPDVSRVRSRSRLTLVSACYAFKSREGRPRDCAARIFVSALLHFDALSDVFCKSWHHCQTPHSAKSGRDLPATAPGAQNEAQSAFGHTRRVRADARGG